MHDDKDTANIIEANSVIYMLTEMRGNGQNVGTYSCRKRINIAAGWSVSATDFNSNQMENGEVIEAKASTKGGHCFRKWFE